MGWLCQVLKIYIGSVYAGFGVFWLAEGVDTVCWRRKGDKQESRRVGEERKAHRFGMTNEKWGVADKAKGKSRIRFASGMTERKADATAKAQTNQAVAGTSFGAFGRGAEMMASLLRVRYIMAAPKRMLPRAATWAFDMPQ
jgi:hypothetical protein